MQNMPTARDVIISKEVENQKCFGYYW